MPALDSAPFTLTKRQDVVNAALAALIPPEEIMVLLDYVVSLSMRRRIKPPLLHHGNFLNQRGARTPKPLVQNPLSNSIQIPLVMESTLHHPRNSLCL